MRRYSLGMSHLIPEVRVNKNGIPVIKHVLADKPEVGGVRPIPSPLLPAAPEQQSALPDYDLIAARNEEFERRSDSVLMSPLDLTAFSDLLDYAAKESDDGDNRIWYTGQLIKYGNVGAAKTILAYIEEHQSSYESHEFAFDVWRSGAIAGIFEEGKDYTADPEEMGKFTFIAKFFEGVEHEGTIQEAENDLIRTAASIYEIAGSDVEPDDLVEYYEERGDLDLDAYLEYLGTHNGTRDGVL